MPSGEQWPPSDPSKPPPRTRSPLLVAGAACVVLGAILQLTMGSAPVLRDWLVILFCGVGAVLLAVNFVRSRRRS